MKKDKAQASNKSKLGLSSYLLQHYAICKARLIAILPGNKKGIVVFVTDMVIANKDESAIVLKTNAD